MLARDAPIQSQLDGRPIMRSTGLNTVLTTSKAIS